MQIPSLLLISSFLLANIGTVTASGPTFDGASAITCHPFEPNQMISQEEGPDILFERLSADLYLLR